MLSKVLSFGLGLVIGGGLGIIASRKFFRDKYEKQYQEEAAANRAMYRKHMSEKYATEKEATPEEQKSYDEACATIPKESFKTSTSSVGDVTVTEKAIDITQFHRENKMTKTDYTSFYKGNTSGDTENGSYEENKYKPDDPEFIDEDEGFPYDAMKIYEYYVGEDRLIDPDLKKECSVEDVLTRRIADQLDDALHGDDDVTTVYIEDPRNEWVMAVDVFGKDYKYQPKEDDEDDDDLW